MKTDGEKWVVKEQGDANEYVMITDKNRWIVAFRMNGEFMVAKQRKIVQMFAAAPELLEALKWAMQHVRVRNVLTAEDRNRWAAEYGKAERAIAKAEGR